MKFQIDPKQSKKIQTQRNRYGKGKKSIYINDKVNYDKIMKSYLGFKGQSIDAVFVYNQERLPSQYFKRKTSLERK